jgi:subtilisin family serine protease
VSPIPAPLDDGVLRRFVFQTFGRARRTQDSPVVPDVWLRYIRVAEDIANARIARKPLPDDAVDLLLTPWSGARPGDIAKQLRDRLEDDGRHVAARIAQSTTRVVVSVNFLTLVRDVVPMTGWWRALAPNFRTIFQWFYESLELDLTLSAALSHAGSDVEFFRYAALVGFVDCLMNAGTSREILELENLARQLGTPTTEKTALQKQFPSRADEREGKPKVKEVARLTTGYEHAIGERADITSAAPVAKEGGVATGNSKGIFLINLNRPAAQNLFESRLTVKADAAHRVFDISTEGIKFAVIDGGIDATHAAFLKRSDREFEERLTTISTLEKEDLHRWSRVFATYDFTILRDIIASGGNPELAPEANRAAIARLAGDPDPQINRAFEHLKVRSDNARDLDWEIVSPLISVPHDKGYQPPGSDHGTHVAGILAADLPKPLDFDQPLCGVCRNLSLYDLRVFDHEGRGDEFAILCALEFVDWMNRDRANPMVHGVNLSLALAHDVDSFACGQTPICEVCNHLVGAGTVVVAAAGNTGFEGGVEKQSLGSGYRPISITDPGNADMVITVGSTHRRDPHAYGVSYFSARGPTGDGRRKPDILAPGEKITSTIRDGRTQRMDGTSMAAPHVSGAAALLMARYPELIGHPLRIKEILMKSATDLNREQSFQGAGLLDVLRALQSV